MKGDKSVLIEVVGNAYKVQLHVDDETGFSGKHGKPVVVLDTASDEVLGKAVRDLFRTRVRTARKREQVPA
ncbi:MAG: hypothetical protein HW377_1813 [Actinobacteria bacterium]|nr:hypothetical protein [Actinomycetota bacterium]MBM2828700.1 hypothetical protein [Actinomycetota bacterium]